MRLKVVVHRAEEGAYWAEVPAIPGCVSRVSRGGLFGICAECARVAWWHGSRCWQVSLRVGKKLAGERLLRLEFHPGGRPRLVQDLLLPVQEAQPSLPFSKHGVIRANRVSPCWNLLPLPRNSLTLAERTARRAGSTAAMPTNGVGLPRSIGTEGLTTNASPNGMVHQSSKSAPPSASETAVGGCTVPASRRSPPLRCPQPPPHTPARSLGGTALVASPSPVPRPRTEPSTPVPSLRSPSGARTESPSAAAPAARGRDRCLRGPGHSRGSRRPRLRHRAGAPAATTSGCAGALARGAGGQSSLARSITSARAFASSMKDGSNLRVASAKSSP